MMPARRRSSFPRKREPSVFLSFPRKREPSVSKPNVTGSRLSRGRPPILQAAGFSLLEVLVAFVILALVATALFELFGGALRTASISEEWSRALLVAQSRLTLAASAAPLREATDAGTEDDGRIAWQTVVAPYVIADANPELERQSEFMATRLYRVSVDVRYAGGDGKERTLALSTLKLGARLVK
jgi:general secretion pathway protein I